MFDVFEYARKVSSIDSQVRYNAVVNVLDVVGSFFCIVWYILLVS